MLVELMWKTFKICTMNEFILEKFATQSHLNGDINIGGVPEEYLPNVGQVVIVVLDELTIAANFISANGYRINSVQIGNWLQQKNIQVGSKFFIKICNNNTFHFCTNAQ